MTQAQLFDGADTASAAFLRRVRRGQVTAAMNTREQVIAIAHGLAFDPHVDGRLRLTPRGRDRLAPVTQPERRAA